MTIHKIGDKNFTQNGPLLQVGPRGQQVRVFTSKTTGQKFARLANYAVSLDICGLSAGRDAWMRDILFRCTECKTRTTAGTLECGLCETCYDKAGEENAIADGNS